MMLHFVSFLLGGGTDKCLYKNADENYMFKKQWYRVYCWGYCRRADVWPDTMVGQTDLRFWVISSQQIKAVIC